MSGTENKQSEKEQTEEHCEYEDDDEPEPVLTEDEIAEQERKRRELEKAEEEKLKSRFPSLKGTGSSELLQKRLSRGNKYFDSGDYNMAKAKVGPGTKLLPGQKPPLLLGQTGEAIPTPETVPHKKVGPLQSKLANPS